MDGGSDVVIKGHVLTEGRSIAVCKGINAIVRVYIVVYPQADSVQHTKPQLSLQHGSQLVLPDL